MRIVSLLPSATEIVYALGLAEQLVGVTFECDEPADARRDNTVVVGGRDTSDMSPGDIDAYVRTQAAAGADLYHLHRDALAGLTPDLVLTQDLCRVCALPAGQVTEALDFLGCRADVVALDPYTLADVLASIETVACAAGIPENGRRLTVELQRRLDAVAATVAGRRRPRVAVIEWVDPPFTAGHWIPDLVQAAGGEAVGSAAGRRSVPTSWAAIAATQPEIAVVAPCGFGLDAAAAQAGIVARELPDAAIWAIDGNGLIVRPGPRLVDGVEALAGILHPEVAVAPPGTIRHVR